MNDNTVFQFNQLKDTLSGNALNDAKIILFEILHKFKPYIRRNNLRVKIDGYRGLIKSLDNSNPSQSALQ